MLTPWNPASSSARAFGSVIYSDSKANTELRSALYVTMNNDGCGNFYDTVQQNIISPMVAAQEQLALVNAAHWAKDTINIPSVERADFLEKKTFAEVKRKNIAAEMNFLTIIVNNTGGSLHWDTHTTPTTRAAVINHYFMQDPITLTERLFGWLHGHVDVNAIYHPAHAQQTVQGNNILTAMKEWRRFSTIRMAESVFQHYILPVARGNERDAKRATPELIRARQDFDVLLVSHFNMTTAALDVGNVPLR